MMISYVGRLSPNLKQREKGLLVMRKLLEGLMRAGEVNLLLWYVPFWYSALVKSKGRLTIVTGLRAESS